MTQQAPFRISLVVHLGRQRSPHEVLQTDHMLTTLSSQAINMKRTSAGYAQWGMYFEFDLWIEVVRLTNQSISCHQSQPSVHLAS